MYLIITKDALYHSVLFLCITEPWKNLPTNNTTEVNCFCRAIIVSYIKYCQIMDTLIALVGLAAFYAWVRAKHFGCHSLFVILSSQEVTFMSSNVNIACSTATSLSPLIGKVTFYCTFVSREPHKV